MFSYRNTRISSKFDTFSDYIICQTIFNRNSFPSQKCMAIFHIFLINYIKLLSFDKFPTIVDIQNTQIEVNELYCTQKQHLS